MGVREAAPGDARHDVHPENPKTHGAAWTQPEKSPVPKTYHGYLEVSGLKRCPSLRRSKAQFQKGGTYQEGPYSSPTDCWFPFFFLRVGKGSL